MSTPHDNTQPASALTPPAATPVAEGFWSGMSKPYKAGFLMAGSVLALSGGWIGMKQFTAAPPAAKADTTPTQLAKSEPEKPKPGPIDDDPLFRLPPVGNRDLPDSGKGNSPPPLTVPPSVPPIIDAPPVPLIINTNTAEKPKVLPKAIKDDFSPSVDLKIPPIPGEVPTTTENRTENRREGNSPILRVSGQGNDVKPPSIPPVPEEIPLPKIPDIKTEKTDKKDGTPELLLPKIDVKLPGIPKVETGPAPKLEIKTDPLPTIKDLPPSIPTVKDPLPPIPSAKDPPTSITIPEIKFQDPPKRNEPDPLPTINVNPPKVDERIPPTKIDPIDVRPAPPMVPSALPGTIPSEAPKRDIYEEDWHTPTGAETYAAVCKMYYSGATEYAAALEAYNKDRKKQGENIIRVPPTWVLKEKFPELVEKGERRNVPDVRTTSGQGNPRVDPVGNGDNRDGFRPPPPAANVSTAPSVSEEYRIKTDGGEMIRDIARKVLGDAGLWKRIYDLNPAIDPTQPIPTGTTLRLPK